MSSLTLSTLRRRLAAALPGDVVVHGEGSTLEASLAGSEAPRLIAATLLEGGPLRAHRVEGAPLPAFAAFLDGTQASEIVAHPQGIPVVHGTIAAVVRERRARRLTTWQHLVARALYAPRALLDDVSWSTLVAAGAPLVDTTDGDTSPLLSHPFAVRDAAVHRVQRDREVLESTLGEDWCAHRDEPLLIDGGISGSDRIASAPGAVGVVKTHRTLYADGDALRAVLALRAGERSSVFRVSSARRAAVASWYLRLRDPRGRDPMWGLVRVEIALPNDPASRANEVSRWILAEVSPLALPDARWDRMVYGVRDCEEFLRAVV